MHQGGRDDPDSCDEDHAQPHHGENAVAALHVSAQVTAKADTVDKGKGGLKVMEDALEREHQ